MAKWSLAERKVLRKFAGQLQAHQIAQFLPGRSYYGVQHQAKTMGISLKAFGAYHHNAKYDSYERNRILEMRRQGKTYPQMVSATGIPKSAIQYILETEIVAGKPWTTDETKLLQMNAKLIKVDEILSLLPGRSRQSIYRKARELGFGLVGIGPAHPRAKYTRTQYDQALEFLHQGHAVFTVAKALDIPPKAVAYMRDSLYGQRWKKAKKKKAKA